MTAFTKDAPFEFESGKVYENGDHVTVLSAQGNVLVGNGRVGRAIYAMYHQPKRTKWQPVTFADVKVGDTVKSVSPCGTVRRGVVDQWYSDGRAYDIDTILVARSNWTLYRRAPKPAKFVPQDVPEVGQWIRAVLAGGSAQEFLVVTVEEGTSSWLVESAARRYHIDKDAQPCIAPERIDSWRPIDPPAPAEPTGMVSIDILPNLDAWKHIGFLDERGPAEPVKTAGAIATVEVRLDLGQLADDLQATADAVRARLEDGLHS